MVRLALAALHAAKGPLQQRPRAAVRRLCGIIIAVLLVDSANLERLSTKDIGGKVNRPGSEAPCRVKLKGPARPATRGISL
jgi:hypothetical protein